MTEMLCRDLETPSNSDRWRQLEGEDPDMEQLAAKVQVLEERLNDKKEQLLEKELVLEEVSSLSDKLRRQASDGRADTLALAKRVNEFQSRIKETTRKMMATVSELSMYQVCKGCEGWSCSSVYVSISVLTFFHSLPLTFFLFLLALFSPGHRHETPTRETRP
jgi:hypothetical protein